MAILSLKNLYKIKYTFNYLIRIIVAFFIRETSCIFTEVWFHTYWFPIEYLDEQFYLSDWMDRSNNFNEVLRIQNGTIILSCVLA